MTARFLQILALFAALCLEVGVPSEAYAVVREDAVSSLVGKPTVFERRYRGEDEVSDSDRSGSSGGSGSSNSGSGSSNSGSGNSGSGSSGGSSSGSSHGTETAQSDRSGNSGPSSRSHSRKFTREDTGDRF